MSPLFYILPPVTSFFFFPPVTSFKNYFLIHSVLLSLLFCSTSAYNPSTIYLHGALQRPMILKCLCFLNRIRFKKKIYVFQSFYTKWSTHTGSPNASKQSIYPLETWNKFRRQCPPSQRSSDASHGFICSSITLWKHTPAVHTLQSLPCSKLPRTSRCLPNIQTQLLTHALSRLAFRMSSRVQKAGFCLRQLGQQGRAACGSGAGEGTAWLTERRGPGSSVLPVSGSPIPILTGFRLLGAEDALSSPVFPGALFPSPRLVIYSQYHCPLSVLVSPPPRLPRSSYAAPWKWEVRWATSAQLPNPFSDRAHALAWRATLSILPMREHSSLLFARSDVISLWFYLLIFFNGKRKKKHLLWEKENLLSFKIIKSKNLKNAHNKSFGLRKNILLFLSTRHLRLCLFVFYWSIADLQQFFKEQIIHVYYTSLQRHKGVCREKWGEGKTVSSPETSITSLFTMTKTRLPSMETE